MKKYVLIGVILLLLLGVTSALAQTGGTYDLSWNTVAGGGEMFSTGGTYSLGGSAAQPAVGGAFTGGNYSLTSGFWVEFQPYHSYLPAVRK